jgi:BirA family biotin operon repressor/biotin-[acetyl-CoA-carboxylase] ligase
MSLVLRPQRPEPEEITLVASLAVIRAVKQSTGLSARIRWPNDIMLNDKKLAGVLAQAQSSGKDVTEVIVGMGLNCNTKVEIPSDPRGKSTSLSEELGRPVDLTELRASSLGSFADMYSTWHGGQNMTQLWSEHVGTLGLEVMVKLKTHETSFSCQAIRLKTDGALVVATRGGDIIIHAEDLEWLREGPQPSSITD